MREIIHFFHTNDLHSHFTYWKRSQSFIQMQRKMLSDRGETSFLVDLGDHLDRSNLYTEATLGKGNIKMLNEAQYDVVTIGNNEGITLPYNVLYHLYDDAEFEVVVGNLYSQFEENPRWMKPYTILTTRYGTKIAVIAATAQFDLFYKELGWEVTTPRAELIKLAFKLKKQADIIICMSHLGITEDELLAQECPIIDVIFGSHTHHVFEQGSLENNVLLTGGGKFGQYTGQLEIEYDHATRTLTEKKDRLYENALLPEVENEGEWLIQLQKEAKLLLDKPVFTLTKSYNKEWFHRSQLSDLFAECMYDYTGADCVMFNAGIFVDKLRKGLISTYDIHKILPHPINICVIQITGSELKEIFLQSENEEWSRLELKGLGFRGIIFGKILNYGIEITKQRELFINGHLMEPDKVYRLATLDLFTFGYFFPSFKYAKKEYYLPDFIRDVFKNYCMKKFQ
ncbi:bifunctional UDP-sugar hydrolase/5'-nucleotidase [Solibacillus sp. FSL W8-0372]|uniref:bifunctional metallophosphatase/5'-nucleotidase n=1 Tax=Solibacillus sp. FSL W8-0372 TaxID=2921713 RepID=UPI0030CF00CF